MKKIAVLAAISLIFLAGLPTQKAHAQSEAGVLFLQISPGVRADGMGEAFVALANDASAVYWNTGGLGFLNGHELLIMHSNWLPQLAGDLFYDYVSYIHHINGLGTFGASVTYLNLGQQNVTLENGPEVVDHFTSYDFAVSGAFGTLLGEHTGVGLNMKVIRSNLAPFGAGKEKGTGQTWSFGVDLGVLYQAPFLKNLNLGMNLTNMGPKISYIDVDQADPQPTTLKAGLAYHIINSKYNKLTYVLDFDKLLVRRYKDGTSDPFYKAIFTSWTDQPIKQEMKEIITHTGLEYWYSNLIALRVGYWYDELGNVKPYTFGAGLKYSLYRFDFGYIAAGEGHPLTDTMRFSLTIGF